MYEDLKNNPIAPQSVKNKIHKFKIEGKYIEYLAFQTAYLRYKLWLEKGVINILL